LYYAERVDFAGQPLEEVEIADVDWTHRGEYIRTRSVRHPGDFDVEPEWATQTVFDEERLLGPDPASKSGRTLRIVGYAPAVDKVLVVLIMPKHWPRMDGSWWGVNAWLANSTLHRRYYRPDE
jgi:hypothetical protein